MKYELIDFITKHKEAYPDLADLFEDYKIKEKEFAKSNDHYNTVKKEIEAKYEKLRRDTLQPYYEKAMELKLPWVEAEKMVEKRIAAIKTEIANATQDGPLKPGTEYTYWDRGRHSLWTTSHWQPKFNAVIEVWTRESKIAGNRPRWRDNPMVGDVVLRRLKKDGTPSSMFGCINKHNRENPIPYGYYPKGVNPNAAT